MNGTATQSYLVGNGAGNMDVTQKAEQRARKKENLAAQLSKIRQELAFVEEKIKKIKSNEAKLAFGQVRSPPKQTTSGRITKPAAKLQGEGGADKRGLKRKSTDKGFLPESREARKQIILKERARRVQSLWTQCGTILKQLKQNRNAWPFHKPVDWKALNIPDYPQIVKNPMDMQTIAEKLGGFDARCKEGPRSYVSPLEFRDDVRQIFDNCKIYNPIGSDVRFMGDSMLDMFEKKWHGSNVEGKYAQEIEYQKREDEELKALKAGKRTGADQMDYLDNEFSKLKKTSSPAGKKAKTDGVMDFEAKRKLSVNLGMLPAEKLGRVIQIINEGPSKIDNNEEEIELDIDKLDNETLFKLDRYVKNCLRGDKKAKQRDRIEKMHQMKDETARKLEDVNATLASRSAATSEKKDYSPVSSKPQLTDGKDSDSSDSESGPDSGAGENDLKRHSSLAGDVTRASTTIAPQQTILKDTVTDREINLKNAEAWQTFTTTPLKELKKENVESKPEAPTGDSLWSEFQNREQQIRAREKSKEVHAEHMRLVRQEAEETARIKAEEERTKQYQQAKAEMAKERQEINAIREAEKAEILKEMDANKHRNEHAKVIRKLQYGNPKVLISLGLTYKDDAHDPYEEGADAEDGEL